MSKRTFMELYTFTLNRVKDNRMADTVFFILLQGREYFLIMCNPGFHTSTERMNRKEMKEREGKREGHREEGKEGE
jgi:23S rRNA A1618 N6-methylase RlmF